MSFSELSDIIFVGLLYGMAAAATASLIGYGVNKAIHLLDIITR